MKDIRFPVAVLKILQWLGAGIIVERERKKVKQIQTAPLLVTTVKPKLELLGKNYGSVIFEGLTGSLDFLKDDKNTNSSKFHEVS